MALLPASSNGRRSVKGAPTWRGCRRSASTIRRTWFRPLPTGIDPLDPVAAVQHGPDAVAAPGQQSGERRHEVDQDRPLLAVGLGRPEVHGRAQVEQEPGVELAILGVLAQVRRIHPRRDVPVDGADVVAELVLPQVGQVETVAAEQAPVITLEQSVEAADDLPVEALEDALRRGRRRSGAPSSGRSGPARCAAPWSGCRRW